MKIISDNDNVAPAHTLQKSVNREGEE